MAAHLLECRAAMQAGQMLALLLCDDAGDILGRINLHQIEHGSARIGYRLAESACGRGLASLAVAQVCSWAMALGLQSLRTFVVKENLASARVLAKNGFVCVGQSDRLTPLTAGDASCDAWWRQLSHP